MRKFILFLFLTSLLNGYSTGYNCTINLCIWVGWSQWEPCWSNATQRRTRLACCPENLKIRTLEECLNVCRTMGLSTMSIQDAYIYRHCIIGQVNNTGFSLSQLTSNSSSVNGLVPQYQEEDQSHALLVYLCSLAGLLTLAAIASCCLCYCLCGRKKRDKEKQKVHPQQNTLDF